MKIIINNTKSDISMMMSLAKEHHFYSFFEIPQVLNAVTLPLFVDQLSNVTVNASARVVESTANINAIVVILGNVANTTSTQSIPVNSTVMEVCGLGFPKYSNRVYATASFKSSNISFPFNLGYPANCRRPHHRSGKEFMEHS